MYLDDYDLAALTAALTRAAATIERLGGHSLRPDDRAAEAAELRRLRDALHTPQSRAVRDRLRGHAQSTEPGVE